MNKTLRMLSFAMALLACVFAFGGGLAPPNTVAAVVVATVAKMNRVVDKPVTALSSWSAAYLVDVGSGGAVPVVVAKVGEIRRPFGWQFNLNASTFAGVGSGDRLLAGAWLSYRARAAENVWVSFGPSVRFEDQRIRSPGLLLGFEISF